MALTHFNMDYLRSFVTGVELGSFARAAARLNRSTSAISTHLRRLEEQAGTKLFRKQGRGLELTADGETLLAYARRILDLNDEVASDLSDQAQGGELRIGLQHDFAATIFRDVLAKFRRTRPKLLIRSEVGRNEHLVERVKQGACDLALAWSVPADGICKVDLGQVRMQWLGPPRTETLSIPTDRPIPMIAYDSHCAFRVAAMDALANAERRWDIVAESPDLQCIHAATAAGIGITARTAIGLPDDVAVLDGARWQLPELPLIGISAYTAATPQRSATTRLVNALLVEMGAVLRPHFNSVSGEPGDHHFTGPVMAP